MFSSTRPVSLGVCLSRVIGFRVLCHITMALCSLGQGRRAPACRCRRRGGGVLDCRCARRSACRQVGTKGWSFSIEQRDAAFALSSTSPCPMANLLYLTHTTRLQSSQMDEMGSRSKSDLSLRIPQIKPHESWVAQVRLLGIAHPVRN